MSNKNRTSDSDSDSDCNDELLKAIGQRVRKSDEDPAKVSLGRIEVCLKEGVDINAQDGKGDEVSQMADRKGYRRIVVEFENLCEQNSSTNYNVHWLHQLESGEFVRKESRGNIDGLLTYMIGSKRGRNNDGSDIVYLTEDQVVAKDKPVVISDTAGIGTSTLFTYLAKAIENTESDLLVLKFDSNHHAAALSYVKGNWHHNLGTISDANEFLVKALSNLELESPEKGNLLSLYEHFVKNKFDIFYKEQSGNFHNVDLIAEKEDRYDRFIDTYEKLALDPLFDEETVNELLPCRTKPSNLVERNGIITQFFGGKPKFGHRTYAEYFAAKFLSDKLTGYIPDSVKEIILETILCEFEYTTVRAFLNCLLSDEVSNPVDSESWKSNLDEDEIAQLGIILQKGSAEGNHQIIKLVLNLICKNPQDRNTIINFKDSSRWTAVHWAVYNGHLDITKLLFENGNVDINSTDDRGLTLLQLAAQASRVRIMEYLLEKEADPHCRNEFGETLLHVAARDEELDVMHCLLAHGSDVNSEIKYGWNLLHEAAHSGKLCVVQSLIAHGANVNYKTNNASTPLHLAVYAGHLDVVEYLLEKGADAHIQDHGGKTPLHEAASVGNLHVVQYLIAYEADVNCTENNALSPLHLAASAGHLEVVDYLLREGAVADCSSYGGKTLLHRAVGVGKMHVVQNMLAHRCNVNSKMNDGRTPLHQAASTGNLDVVKYLLEKGADTDIVNNKGKTPLHEAAFDGNSHIVPYLIAYGADVNCTDYDDSTPLHIAASAGHLEVVEYLLGEKADADRLNRGENTPLDAAIAAGNLHVAQLLWAPTIRGE